MNTGLSIIIFAIAWAVTGVIKWLIIGKVILVLGRDTSKKEKKEDVIKVVRRDET